MAGAGYKLFNTGDVLTAAQVNTYLQEQTVMVFANASARTTALSGVLAEGMITYLKDDDKIYKYTGSTWTDIAGTGGGLTLIQETVAAANSAIDFTSIPGTYKQLLLYWDGIYHSTSGSRFDIRFNSDSGSNYKSQLLYWDGTLASTGGDYTSLISGAGGGIYAPFGYQITSSTNYPAGGFLTIDNYASSTKFKHYNAGWNFSETGTAVRYVPFLNGHYASQTAITSINVVRMAGTATMTNVTNTTVRLYGVA